MARQNGLQHPRTATFESLASSTLDPESEYVPAVERAEAVLDWLGGKAVVKPDRGMMGAGLSIVDSVESFIQATSTTGVGVVQEFVPEAATTLRVIATRREAVAAFARTAAEGDWRANVALGASLTPVPLNPDGETARLATATVRAFGLNMAGVDIVTTPDGPLMLEANPSFGVPAQPELITASLDRLVAALNAPGCSCGHNGPHDAWACQ